MLMAWLPRARYAIAFYLVIFGSLIVAAYKLGLVHEKTRAVSPKPLGSIDAVLPGSVSPDSSVLELPNPPPSAWPENVGVSTSPGKQ
jgi:hypothetical protein